MTLTESPRPVAASPVAVLTDRLDPRLLAALGSLCISLSSVFIKVSHTSGTTSAAWRCAFALPALAVLALWERRRTGTTVGRHALIPLLAGIGLGLDFVFWGSAIPLAGAGIATVLLAVQVVIVPLLALIFFRERPSARFLLLLPLLLGGIALAGFTTGATGTDPATGALECMVAGAAYAGYLFLIRQSGGAGTQVRSLLLVTVSAGLVAVIAGTFTGTLDLNPGPAALGWLLALAVVSQVVGWLLIAGALPRMAATTGATLMLLQPVGAVLFGFVLLGERPGALQLLGCGAVVTAVCLAGRDRSDG